jgi:hypothetical protein
MRLGRISRFAAVLVLVAGPTAGIAALAGPAQAATAVPASCTSADGSNYNGGDIPPEIVALNWEICDGFHVNFPAAIYKDESGTWVEVASGSGEASYVCNGTTENQYKNQSGVTITAPCV